MADGLIDSGQAVPVICQRGRLQAELPVIAHVPLGKIREPNIALIGDSAGFHLLLKARDLPVQFFFNLPGRHFLVRRPDKAVPDLLAVEVCPGGYSNSVAFLAFFYSCHHCRQLKRDCRNAQKEKIKFVQKAN